MTTLRRILLCAPLALAALMALSGCLSTRTDSAVAEQFDSLGISLAGIRQANVRAAYSIGLAIEQAADSIIALTDDPTTRTQAILWKIYSIPVIRQIYSQSEPITASVDALAFAMQCEQYFDTGIGRDRFGEHQLIAIKTSAMIQDRLIKSIQRNLTVANSDTLLAAIDGWAREHPLTDHVFSRPSITRELDKLLAQQDQSLGSAIGRIADDVDDLSARLTLISGQLPREARWQGEYLLAHLSAEERLNALDTTLAILTTSLKSIEGSLNQGRLTIDIPGLRSLHADIQAALELLRAERAIILANAERQRRETITALESMLQRSITDASDQVEGIVNRVLWKVGLALAIVLAGAALLGRSRWKPRPPVP
jgi:hypothetical protein